MKNIAVKKHVILAFILLSLSKMIFSQNVEEYFEKGILATQSEKLDSALFYFDKAIEIKDDISAIWYTRATVKSWLRQYEEAILDFDRAIALTPKYSKALNGKACAKQDITDYDGALADFNQAIALDKMYIDAIFNRGTLLELLGKRNEACEDFNLAFLLGDEHPKTKSKVEKCKEKQSEKIYPILRLTKTATDKKYGFTQENPIKVGPGPDGGPANERAYLNLLRDVNGKPIDYNRSGSCCAYESENGLFGMALLDVYEIRYTNEKNEKKTTIVYISMYDYEEPQILYNFKTVTPSKLSKP